MEKHYGWVVVAAGAVITCLAMGAMFALPVYKPAIAAEMGWSDAGISLAMSIGFITMGVAGFGWGTLTDKIGAASRRADRRRAARRRPAARQPGARPRSCSSSPMAG